MTRRCIFNYSTKYDWCGNGLDKKPPPDKLNMATEAKIAAIEKYSAAWLHKILKYQKNGTHQFNGVVFVDCMCNSGSYIISETYPYKSRHGDVETGTSYRIHQLFLNASRNYPDKKFVLILNDMEKTKYLVNFADWV